MTGELRSYEASVNILMTQIMPTGLHLEILTEQPDITGVADAAQINQEELKYIKLTPGSDRHDNIIGEDALMWSPARATILLLRALGLI